MSTTDTQTDSSDVPWYRLKFSIVMFTVTIIAAASLITEYAGYNVAPASGFRLVENGTITHGQRPASYQR